MLNCIKFKLKRPLWVIVSTVLTICMFMPILTITSYWFIPGGSVWEHICSTVLKDYIYNTLVITFGVAFIAGSIGTLTAWLIVVFDFPFKKTINILLMLPLAIPGYIISFTYAQIFNYAGPIQSSIRALFGFESKRDYYFPEIMNLGGVVFVLSIVLYPYVYMIVKPVFQRNSYTLIEVAKTFGYSRFKSFFSISLPLARGAIVAGTSLALMEALNNFATVKYYGVTTFTTGIYRAWFSLESLPAAARLSSILAGFILFIFFIEKWQRGNIKSSFTANSSLEVTVEKTNSFYKYLFMIICLTPPLLGFIIPVIQLLLWSFKHIGNLNFTEYLILLKNSVFMAVIVSLLIVLISIFLIASLRLIGNRFLKICNQISILGYAIPGSVIAIGIMIPLAKIDNSLDMFFTNYFGFSTGLLLSGSIFALAYGYIIRFIAVGYNAIDAGYSKIPIETDHAASLLGAGPLKIISFIHLPIIKLSLVSALLLSFIDIMKELPATLILRPFNFDTLATKTYELTEEEMLPEASFYALSIILISLIPIVYLTLLHSKFKKRGSA